VEPSGGVSTWVENVTCLGCGCACDDIAVRVDGEMIAETRNLCPLGSGWFRASRTTAQVTVDGQGATVDQAIAAAARLLGSAQRPLVFVAPGLSTEEQRACVALADVLHARLDSATTTTALPNVLAGQERGFASATFGEVRHRADLIVYWAIDIANRYPRFVSRYAPPTATVVAVDVGNATTSVDATHRFSIDPADELTRLIGLTRATSEGFGAVFNDKRYVVLVYDAEPDERADRSVQRFSALIALAQSLNDRTRCAAIAMRGSGNVTGADSAFTALTGYPTAVDFGRGYPQYRPHTVADPDVVLVVGDWTAGSTRSVGGARTIAIGSNAVVATLGVAGVSIDAGAAGIHAAGTAVRADDVPLPLRPTLPATRSVGDVLHALLDAVR
jgi:formylmethanofuran dehydrogenase subunit B